MRKAHLRRPRQGKSGRTGGRSLPLLQPVRWSRIGRAMAERTSFEGHEPLIQHLGRPSPGPAPDLAPTGARTGTLAYS